MGRYGRKAVLGGAVLIIDIMIGIAVAIAVGVAIGTNQGEEQGAARANSVVSDYMASEYGADMLERCEQDGLKGCRIEFDYTDGVITGIEVVGHK